MRYRKRPIEVEAIQWTGRNFVEVKNFIKERTDRKIAYFIKRRSSTMTEVLFANLIPDAAKNVTAALWVEANGQYLGIENSEWIIADDLGLYPCKDAQFRKTYEPVTVFEDLRQGRDPMRLQERGILSPEAPEFSDAEADAAYEEQHAEQPSSTPLAFVSVAQMIRERGPIPFPHPSPIDTASKDA